MKKIIGIVVIAVLVLGGFWVMTTYNSLIASDQQVAFTTGQLQNVLTRQFETIKTLGQVVDRYAQHEQSTFVGVAQGRGGGQHVALPSAPTAPKAVTSADPSAIGNSLDLQKQMAQSEQAGLSYINQVNAAVEAYPELKADKEFDKLMNEVEGSTNRVSTERRRQQLAIQEFNNKVLYFPTNVAAAVTGYHSKPFYQADANEQKMPDLFKKD